MTHVIVIGLDKGVRVCYIRQCKNSKTEVMAMVRVGDIIKHNLSLKYCTKYHVFVRWHGRAIGVFRLQGVNQVLQGCIGLLEAMQNSKKEV